jgi:hypothetical protein
MVAKYFGRLTKDPDSFSSDSYPEVSAFARFAEQESLLGEREHEYSSEYEHGQ